jgi:hypothetical protein
MPSTRHRGREDKQQAKINIDTKRLSYINHRITAAQVNCNRTEYSLKTLFPQKVSDMSFTNPTSMVGLQLLKL